MGVCVLHDPRGNGTAAKAVADLLHPGSTLRTIYYIKKVEPCQHKKKRLPRHGANHLEEITTNVQRLNLVLGTKGGAECALPAPFLEHI